MEELKYLNSPVSVKEIKFVAKNLSKVKFPGPNGLTSEIFQTFETMKET